jgi:hypothetical protein
MALTLNVRVVDENVRPVLTPDEAEASAVVEPLGDRNKKTARRLKEGCAVSSRSCLACLLS